MKTTFATALLAAVALSVPAHVFASDTKAPPAPETASIRAAADRAVRAEPRQPAAQEVPVPRPYQGRDRSRKQMGGGGSKTGLVIGVVTALAGTAATLYMVKEMQKSSEAATAGQ
jgi:hypothetical protein